MYVEIIFSTSRLIMKTEYILLAVGHIIIDENIQWL